MPPRGLPPDASVEQLKSGARSLARAVRAGDPGAAAVVREFHPRLDGGEPLDRFSAADGRLVVARSFDFESWDRLEAHFGLVAPLTRTPADLTDEDEDSPAERFLRLACLNYGDDQPSRWAKAESMLKASPGLAHASLATIAAVGDVQAARKALETDPHAVGVQVEPHRWEPLLYLAYSRVVTGSALDTARVLLDHGADPNAGYLWGRLIPPFTALTGVFGSGEGDQPPHPAGLPVARLLLERGADPNDGQTVYNNGGNPDLAWIELLLEFGLGRGDGGPWRRLVGDQQDTPQKMAQDALMSGAHHGFADRVRLLLEHGVDPAGPLVCHPIYEGRRPAEEAALWGYPEIVELLGGVALDDVDELIAATMAGESSGVDRALAPAAIVRYPAQLVNAAEKDSLEAAKLLIDLGFDVNARRRTTALHEAAMQGSVSMIELLLTNGADPSIRDTAYDATPAGWAEHFGQYEAERVLAARAG